jgi:hypothetical protein
MSMHYTQRDLFYERVIVRCDHCNEATESILVTTPHKDIDGVKGKEIRQGNDRKLRALLKKYGFKSVGKRKHLCSECIKLRVKPKQITLFEAMEGCEE